MSDIDYKTLLRDDDKLFDLINKEIKKKYTFKSLCKDIQDEIFEIHKSKDDFEYDDNFQYNQCFYMCNENIKSIKTCKNNSIDNILIKSRQIKKLKILKKTYESDEELSIITIASTKINGVENKVIIKDFYDEYEMMYELFIANILKNDPVIEQHICGYYGKKSDSYKLILEYIQGKTINDLDNLSMKDFSDIMSQLFLILNYAYTKYGFLHGDLHTLNFLIMNSKDNNNELFDISLPLSNGKFIKYKSHYKLVFLDFGLSHMKYKFQGDKVKNIRMIPLEEDIIGFDYSIPLVDISKLLVHIMIEIIYENKNKKINEVGVYIVNLIQYLYSMIGKPNKNINLKFFEKAYENYSYLYDLINSNLDISFEELYIKFVNGTKMDIHKIEEYFNKSDFEKLEGKSLKDEIEDTEIVMKIIYNITSENIKLNDKIEKIVDFVKDLKKVSSGPSKVIKNKSVDIENGTIKNKFSDEQLRYILLNLFQYTCKYELNKNVFIDENDMIININKIYNKFIENDIIYENIKENDKFKVVDSLIEFKLNKFLDCYFENTDIHNILQKYKKLNEISEEQVESLKSENINKILKIFLIKNYNKLPYKIFQKNFIDNEINVKKFNTIEQIKYLANIVFQLKKQMDKLDLPSIKSKIKKNIKLENISGRSQLHHLQLFFYKIYKYCDKYSSDIIEKSKQDYIDWISYNRIILYDYYIRHISLTNVPNKFSKIYLQILDLEDEIWEKFYKKEDFNHMANTLTFSENMLQLLTNKDLSKLINKLDSNDLNTINEVKNDIKSLILSKDNIDEIIKPFKKIYIEF
jgi:hypothetical protein